MNTAVNRLGSDHYAVRMANWGAAADFHRYASAVNATKSSW